MHPVLFTTTIGNIELVILSAKFFGVLAYIVSGLFFYHKAVKLGLNKERLLLVILLGLYILYFAGRLIPFFYNWVKFNRPPIFFYTSYMSYSSILVFILVIIFYSRANKWKAYQLLDIYALANLLDGAINRVGCFFKRMLFWQTHKSSLGVQVWERRCRETSSADLFMHRGPGIIFYFTAHI